MKKLIFLLLILSYVALPQKSVLTQKQRDSIQVMIDATVSGTTPLRTKIVYVEDYGTDEAAILEAIDSAGTNGIVEFEPNRTYIQENGISITGAHFYNGLQLRGNNATLKRGNQQVTTLSAGIDKNTTVLPVDSIPSGWKVGDYLQVYHDSSLYTSCVNSGQRISQINGLNITLNKAVGLSATGADITWAIGDKVRKIYGQLTTSIEGLQGYSIDIDNLNFDGNRDNNSGNYYFSINEAIWVSGQSTITNCNFYEMPNENIFGNGFHIDKCYAYNLNGSFVHTTGLTSYTTDNFYGTVSNCLTDSTNLISTNRNSGGWFTGDSLNGHCESLITNSATAGRINVHNNFFFNGNEAVIPANYYFDEPGGASRDYIFTDNFCSGFPRISAIQWRNTSAEHHPGNFVISNNVFRDCGDNDWSDFAISIVGYDSVAIYGNQLWGNTTWTNIPFSARRIQGFETDDIKTDNIDAQNILSTGIEIATGDLLVWNPDVLGVEVYDFANAISDTSGSEANDDLGWDLVGTPTLSVESVDVQTGSYSLKLTATVDAGVEGMRDSLVLSAGQTYKVSLWAKAGVTADTISQALTAWYNSDNTVIDGSPNGVYVDTVWTKYLYYITPTTDTIFISAYVQTYGTAYGGSIGDELFIDNLSIQKVQGGDIIARGNLGYGNYYFENPTPTNGYVLKTDGNGVATWQPDISTSGTGLFNPDGITIDTTAGGLARITLAYQDSIHAKINRAEMTSYSKTGHTHAISAVVNLQDSLTAKANTAWFAISPTLIDDSIAVKMNRSEMTGYSATSHTHIEFSDTVRVGGWSIGMGNTDLDTLIAGSFGGIKIPNDYTVTEVAAYTNSGTVTFNIEERAETTPNTSGTDVMTSDLVADTDQQETGTFSNATLDRDDWLILTIVSITGEPTIFSVTVRGVKTD